MQSTCIRVSDESARGLERGLFLHVSPVSLLSRIPGRHVVHPTITSGTVIEFSVLVAATIRLTLKSKFVSSPTHTRTCTARSQ